MTLLTCFACRGHAAVQPADMAFGNVSTGTWKVQISVRTVTGTAGLCEDDAAVLPLRTMVRSRYGAMQPLAVTAALCKSGWQL